MIHFLYLGNLLMQKGPLDLLRACTLLHERGVAFTCHIVGAPTAEIPLQHMEDFVREHNLQEQIILHGAQYGTAKEKLLEQADVMVFPTYYCNECFPLVLLEGMKHSLALISTDEGAIPDIIRHRENGLVVEKQNPEALADAMELLSRQPELTRQLALAANRDYEQHFSENHFITRMRDIFHSI